jgi:hypothetical protein
MPGTINTATRYIVCENLVVDAIALHPRKIAAARLLAFQAIACGRLLYAGNAAVNHRQFLIAHD